MSTDVLSEVLRSVRLTGAIFFLVDGAAPWVAEAPHASTVAASVLPGAEHVIEYHVVTKGSCYAGLIDEPPVHLVQGDVVVFPHGDSHTVSSAPGMRCPVRPDDYVHPENGQLPVALRFENEGSERVELICGFIGCDARPFNPLIAALPRVLHVERANAAASVWIEQLVGVAATESKARKPGSQGVLARLSELMFIEAVRYYLTTLPPEQSGWFAALRDDVTGRALTLLHDRPAHDWSLDELAREVGQSRSLLAERFAEFVGDTPMHYLARWRMQLAASLLAGTTASLAEIAARVGYGSEAALSRAFKRLVGESPATWRASRVAAARG